VRVEALDHVEGRVVQIACGLEHSMCLMDTGRVCTWGTGAAGQLYVDVAPAGGFTVFSVLIVQQRARDAGQFSTAPLCDCPGWQAHQANRCRRKPVVGILQ